MEAIIEELNERQNSVNRRIKNELELIRERGELFCDYERVMDLVGKLSSGYRDLKKELERKQDEVDDLEEQLEQKDKLIDDLQRQLQAETGDLRQQLLEAKNLHLEAEKQHLEVEASAKPMEIHNHFEPGSSSQVFNDKVNGRFARRQNVRKDKKDKKDKKRWKKIVRKVL